MNALRTSMLGGTLLCALLACEPATPDGDTAREDAMNNGTFAHMTVSPAQVPGGGQVTLTLMNHGEQQLGYNLCPASLERRMEQDWEQRPERPAEVCTMELRILEPGASATYEHTMPAVPAGTYRFRVNVEWPLGGDQVAVTSEPFDVSE